VEAFTFTALERAWQEANELHQREHVTPFFYEDIPPKLLQPSPPPSPTSDHWQVRHTTSPRGFRVALLHHHPDYGHHRWTVDTPEDLTLVRAIVSRLPNDTFTWREVLALFEREPELAQINAHVPHKTARDVDERF
jgi:spore coat polysaccharide biosynthesis protein SpsF